MNFITTISILLAATIANAQEIEAPTIDSEFTLVPAVKKTATVSGESYVISRDADNRILFVKKDDKDFAVRPMIIKLEPPKETP